MTKIIDISNLIDKHLEREAKERNPNVIWASEVAYCLRKLYYKQKQPREVSKETRRVMHTGNLIHNFLSWVLQSNQEENGYKFVKSEKQIAVVDGETEMAISGRVDDVCLIEKDNELIAIEAKSTKSIEPINKPMMHHVWQLMIYLRAMHIKRGIIIYLHKNTLQTKQFEVRYDPEIFKQILSKAREYHKHVSGNTLPDKQPTAGWECSYCEYKDLCDANKAIS